MKPVYAIFDTQVNEFVEQPFLQRTKGEAIRGWSEQANNPQSQISKHATDYALFELGTYDEKTGAFTNHPAPIRVGLASEFKKPVEERMH